MKKIIDTIQPILYQYRIESIFISISFVILLGSFIPLVKGFDAPIHSQTISPDTLPRSEISAPKYYVEVSGAVKKPGVYEIDSTKRLHDLISMAGGLSSEADSAYVSRNFNMARLLNDQEKIHVPSKAELKEGLFPENNHALQSTQSNPSSTQSDSNQSSSKININTGTFDELDSLPGIGKTIAEKIIQNRPYTSLNELTEKKIINASTYQQVSSMLEL